MKSRSSGTADFLAQHNAGFFGSADFNSPSHCRPLDYQMLTTYVASNSCFRLQNTSKQTTLHKNIQDYSLFIFESLSYLYFLVPVSSRKSWIPARLCVPANSISMSFSSSLPLKGTIYFGINSPTFLCSLFSKG